MPRVRLSKGETEHQCQGCESLQAMRNNGRSCSCSSREADLKKIGCCCLFSNARWAIILKTDAPPGEKTRPEMGQPRYGVMALELVNSLLGKGLQNHGNTIYVMFMEII